MFFWRDWTLSEGASRYSSDGFFDGDDYPACDTWVYLETGASKTGSTLGSV